MTNYILYYFALVIFYWGLSTLIYFPQLNQNNIKSLEELPEMIQEESFCATLVDIQRKGNIFKSHNIKLLLTGPYMAPRFLTFQTGTKLAQELELFRGHSIAQKTSASDETNFQHNIPCLDFVQDESYGKWFPFEDQWVWVFYPPFSQHFKDLPIGQEKLTIREYQQILENKAPLTLQKKFLYQKIRNLDQLSSWSTHISWSIYLDQLWSLPKQSAHQDIK